MSRFHILQAGVSVADSVALMEKANIAFDVGASDAEKPGVHVAVVVKTVLGSHFGIPFWLVGEFTTHFRTYFSGWIGMFTGG